MQSSKLRIAVFLSSALAFLATGARAHELTCKLTLAALGERGGVIGKPATVLSIDHYPTAVQLDFTVINDIATKGSTALGVFLWELPYPFVPPVPFTVPPGGSLSTAVTGVISSQEQCLAINHPREIGEISVAVDFTGHVIFDTGQALCTARLLCGAEIQPQDAGPQLAPTSTVN